MSRTKTSVAEWAEIVALCPEGTTIVGMSEHTEDKRKVYRTHLSADSFDLLIDERTGYNSAGTPWTAAASLRAAVNADGLKPRAGEWLVRSEKKGATPLAATVAAMSALHAAAESLQGAADAQRAVLRELSLKAAR